MGLAAYPNVGCFDIGGSGTLWAVNSPGGTYQLLSIDMTTGAPTLLGVLTGVTVSGVMTGLASDRTCILASSEVVRAGTPPNPVALRPGATTPPAVGRTWDPFVDHTTFFPAALADLLIVSPTAVNVPTPFGTLLANLGGPMLVFVTTPTTRFFVSIPAGCNLVGAGLATQAVSIDAVAAGLTNALDVRIGTN